MIVTSTVLFIISCLVSLKNYFQKKEVDSSWTYLNPVFTGTIAISVFILTKSYDFLPCVLFALIFLASANSMKNNKNNLRAMIFSLVITTLAYKLFYIFAPYIWSKNLVVDPMIIAPELREWYAMERDGWEGPILYATSLAILTASVIYSSLGFSKISNIISNSVTKFLVTKIKLMEGVENILKTKNQIINGFILVIILFIFWFLAQVGYALPSQLTPEATVKYSIVLFLIVAVMTMLYSINKNYFLALLSIILVPMCFLSTSPFISEMNYHYVYFPAMKILRGYSLENIYIQYDLLLSLFALPIIYFKKNPGYLEMVAQASTYIYFICIYLVSKKLLKYQKLVVPFILSIILFRIYCALYDFTEAIQITPLRLDWWLVPFFLSLRYRLSHWSVGLSIGILALIHKNFGFIYTLSYIQVILLVLLEEYISTVYSKDKKLKLQFLEILELAKRYLKPLVIIISFYIATYFVYGGIGLNDTAKFYQKIGFGFDRVSNVSFFWYIPAMISFVIITLIQLKNKIPRNYFTSVLFLATIAIGNSLYFLGRSHESNLTWISGSLLLLFFAGFDLAILQFSNSGQLSEKSLFSKKHYFSFYHALSWVFLVSIIYTYETNFINRSTYQIGRVKNQRKFTPAPKPEDVTHFKIYHEKLRKITNGSKKVFFMVPRADFHGYYWGDYDPIAYFTPYESWIFSGNVERFIQNLLDTGYYVVANGRTIKTTVDNLQYKHVVKNGYFTILHNNPIESIKIDK